MELNKYYSDRPSLQENRHHHLFFYCPLVSQAMDTLSVCTEEASYLCVSGGGMGEAGVCFLSSHTWEYVVRPPVGQIAGCSEDKTHNLGSRLG